MEKIYIDLKDNSCRANDSSIIPGMEMESFSDAFVENQLNTHPLEKGTIIECGGFRESFNITINSIKEITSSYILYCGLKNKKGITEEIEIAELFVTPNDKRDIDGKTRIKTCVSGVFESGFYNLIENDSLTSLRQIIEAFCDEYGLHENFIIANQTRYYVKMKRRECPNCTQMYDSNYSHCPYCSNKVNGCKNWLKRLFKYFSKE